MRLESDLNFIGDHIGYVVLIWITMAISSSYLSVTASVIATAFHFRKLKKITNNPLRAVSAKKNRAAYRAEAVAELDFALVPGFAMTLQI